MLKSSWVFEIKSTEKVTNNNKNIYLNLTVVLLFLLIKNKNKPTDITSEFNKMLIPIDK